jgi:hypothetical protein
MSVEDVMTLLSANVPEFWIIGFYIAVATTILTLMGVVLFLWGKHPSREEQAQIYQIHERMTHIADSTPVPDRRAA